MRSRKKSFLAMGVAFLLMLQILPINVFGADGQEQKDFREAIDYTLFSASKSTALSMNGSKISIKGDIHTNADFVYPGSSLSIEGTCEASGKVDVKGSKSTITSKIEGSPVIEMPNYTEDIKSIASVSAEVYKADPEPMVYSITDRTLALSASLSYMNLESSLGSFVGNNGEPELSGFKIIYANNSGSDSLIGNIVEGFMDNGLGSVAIKISRSGKRDAVILSYRGTEFDDDAINDGGTDLIAAALTYNPQASWVFNDANKEYRKLIKKYPNADFYLSGHSLGGRVMQDVLFSVLDDNIGWFSKEVKKPVHCATFNAFGYNKVDFYANKLIQGDVFIAAEGLLNNYYYQYDLVGDGLGASALFKRIGTDKGPWIAKDENRNVIDAPRVPVLNMVFSALHGIDLFYKDSRLKYPQTIGIY